MKDNKKEAIFRKSKRVLSDFQPMQNRFKNIDELYQEFKFQKRKPNTIKINKNKLPADFFPHTQSMRRNFTLNRPSLQDQKERFRQLRSQSQKKAFSPDKTSFFGFFQQKQKNKRPTGHSLNVKRQFESRDEPKRDKMYFEPRNFTPMVNAQKSQILEMFPVSHDQMTYEAIVNSKKIKALIISPIKQQHNTIRQQSYLRKQDPEKYQTKRQNFKQIANIGSPQGSHNITFFNVKSTAFPPIFKNNCVS